MDLAELRVFLTVAEERSFSRAAGRLHRTQPAISQAVRRLEADVGDALFDRTSRDGRLTEAGRVLRDYAERLARLAEETEAAVQALRDLRRGRVLIGSNEAAVHVLLGLVARFHAAHPAIQVDVRRVPARQIPVEVQQGSLDFGVVTFSPAESGLTAVPIGSDELVALVLPSHPFARRRSVSMEEIGRQPVIAHNDPSPARERVLRLFESRHVPLNIVMALPSLDAIKRAIEMQLGVALLPRRCALAEIESGRLIAIRVAQISRTRTVRLIVRRAPRSHAAEAFLGMAEASTRRTPVTKDKRGER
jgi:DNA-binding transcriptional LysR family regulator